MSMFSQPTECGGVSSAWTGGGGVLCSCGQSQGGIYKVKSAVHFCHVLYVVLLDGLLNLQRLLSGIETSNGDQGKCNDSVCIKAVITDVMMMQHCNDIMMMRVFLTTIRRLRQLQDKPSSWTVPSGTRERGSLCR